MKKLPTVFGRTVALIIVIGSLMSFSASWPGVNFTSLVLPKAAQTYFETNVSSSLVENAKRAVAEVADREAKIASAPATDDNLVAEITQETMQDGTISHWDRNTKYLEPNIVSRKYLKLTAKADEVTLKDIEINRGNCSVLNYSTPLQPLELRFGQSAFFMIVCDPVEAKVGTDRGVYIFSW